MSDTHEHLFDLRRRHLPLIGDVNEDMLLKTLAALEYFESKSTTRPIRISLSTFGGVAYVALAIYDRLRLSPCPIYIEAMGPCMSSGSIILQAAKKRILYPNTRFMMHYGSTAVEEKSTDAIAQISFEKEVDHVVMEDIYLERIHKKLGKKGFSRAQLKKLLSVDTYMTANKVLEMGLADEIKQQQKQRKKRKEK